MNIPIYRAKKIDSDEFVEGFLVRYFGFYAILPYNEDTISIGTDFEFSFEDVGYGFTEIDKSTLAVHFPNSYTLSKEKRWYNMEEIKNIIKEFENGAVKRG